MALFAIPISFALSFFGYISDIDRTISPAVVLISIEAPPNMVFIKGGCFEMGQSDEEKEWLVKRAGKKIYDKYFSDEQPSHEACLDDFYMGKHEVTVGEFREFMRETSHRTDAERGVGCVGWTGKEWKTDRGFYWDNLGFSQTDRDPVVCVSWNDANEYVNWKKKKTGLNYRLPTEAEWEYAARSRGKRYRYSWGNGSPTGNIADESVGMKFPEWTIWKGYDDGYIFTAPVGSFEPNEVGLYDMTGNVWEWVQDWYGEDYYRKSPKDNPKGPSSGQHRVLRGGSWFDLPRYVRAADRGGLNPDGMDTDGGFRLALSAPGRFVSSEQSTMALLR